MRLFFLLEKARKNKKVATVYALKWKKYKKKLQFYRIFFLKILDRLHKIWYNNTDKLENRAFL